jgi:CDP-glycerol glycerophosphotransferase (TagB/SpsB family)
MEDSQARAIARFLASTPRDPRQVAFIGRSDSQFAGNCKYLFLHMLRNAPRFSPTYVTLNRHVHRGLITAGLPSVLFPDQDAVTVLAKAGVVVVDDFHYRLNTVQAFTSGAKILQLWHGVGFKKIGFLEAETSLDMSQEQRDYLRSMYSSYDAVISTSPFYTENLFKTSFGAEDIWETGYPRNDVLLRQLTKYDLLGSDPALYGMIRSRAKRHTVCLYAPTFREDHGDPFRHGALNLPELSTFLGANKLVLFIKMHEFSAKHDITNLPNIHVIPNHLDVYPLLPLVNVLITDYSSIYMDFLLLDRPVIFFPYDQKDYAHRLREFQFDYDQMTPGPKCRQQDDIERELLNVLQSNDAYAADRKRIRQMAFSRRDARSAERVMKHLSNLFWK